MTGPEEMAVWVDALASDPWTLRPASASDEEWNEARQLARAESLLNLRQAPPLQQDPVAAMLGLVPDPGLFVDGSAIRRLRGKASVSQIAARLQTYGWEVSAADVRDWQTRPGVVLAPALLERLAKVLGVTTEAITRRTGELVPHAVATSARWRNLVAQFAALLGVATDIAESRLVGALVAAKYRNEAPESYLEAAEAYVTALEKSREG